MDQMEQPPALPGEVWRGMAVLSNSDEPQMCAVAPRPCAVSADGRLLAWTWNGPRWRTAIYEHDRDAILMAWAFHERAVATAERRLRMARAAHTAPSWTEHGNATLREIRAAESELRTLGVEP